MQVGGCERASKRALRRMGGRTAGWREIWREGRSTGSAAPSGGWHAEDRATWRRV